MKRIASFTVGLVLMAVSTINTQAFADPIAKSNTVSITGGYMKNVTVLKWEQTGTTTQQVLVQTGGGYYQPETYQSGTQQVCTTTTVATNHATWYNGHWVSGWSNGVCTTGYSGGGCGYWSPGWYGAPYWNTYQDVTTCTTEPVYSTVDVWIPPIYSTRTQTVPVYNWVPVVEQQWQPVVISSSK